MVAPNPRTAPVSLLSPRRALPRRRMMLRPSAAANPWLNRANRGDGADPDGATTETGEGCPRSVTLQSIGALRRAVLTAGVGGNAPGRSRSNTHRSAAAAVSSRRHPRAAGSPTLPLSKPSIRGVQGSRHRAESTLDTRSGVRGTLAAERRRRHGRRQGAVARIRLCERVKSTLSCPSSSTE